MEPKKFLLLMFILCLALMAFGMCSCNVTIKDKDTEAFMFNKHQYFIFYKDNSSHVVHNPDCWCKKEQYSDYQIQCDSDAIYIYSGPKVIAAVPWGEDKVLEEIIIKDNQ